MPSLFLSVLLLLATASIASAQKTSRIKLQRQRQISLGKLQEAEKILTQVGDQKELTIGQLMAVDQKVKVKEELLGSLRSEINLLNSEISDLSLVVSSLQNDLIALKEEYARMVYSTFKARQGMNILLYLFSSSTFNQLYMRLKYMEYYSAVRKNQAKQIGLAGLELTSHLSDFNQKRREQNTLLLQARKDNRDLTMLKSRKDTMIKQLSLKEDKLRQEVRTRKTGIARLDRIIEEVIKSELSSKRREANILHSENQLNKLFAQKRRKLIWPVKSGFVSTGYGLRPHPVLDGIMEDNTGVEIQTNRGEIVRSVFEGEVRTRAFVPGYNNVVILKHGDYYTVYSKLKEVTVRTGQWVLAADAIGTVHTNSEGASMLHFEVWDKTKKMDPELWLTSKN